MVDDYFVSWYDEDEGQIMGYYFDDYESAADRYNYVLALPGTVGLALYKKIIGEDVNEK